MNLVWGREVWREHCRIMWGYTSWSGAGRGRNALAGGTAFDRLRLVVELTSKKREALKMGMRQKKGGGAQTTVEIISLHCDVQRSQVQ